VDSEAFLQLAIRLLAIPSTADRPAELRRALDLVIDFVVEESAAGPAPLVVERFQSSGKPSALLYRSAGPVRPKFRVILNAHLDVVPAPAEQFVPRLAGDLLICRGAHDMKVSALALAQVFAELAGQAPYPLALQLVTDEEVGGRDGTAYQLDQGVTGQFVIIGEQSGLEIVTDSKGRAQAKLLAVGASAHGAYPWLADNALHSLHRTIEALLRAYPVPAEPVWSTTVNVARIETSNLSYNLVPADAAAWLDIRFPAQDVDFTGASAAEVSAHLQTFCAPGVTAVAEQVDPPHHADQDDPDVLALQQAARAQGYPAGFLCKHGAADGRFYYYHGVPAVIFGIGGAGQHSAAEHADLRTVEPYRAALRAFLLGVEARQRNSVTEREMP
jgi:succinyl-diaminopimelate desuccinylase